MNRIAENKFTENTASTIGVDFRQKNIEINGHDVQLHIWDTAGQEKFMTISKSFYRGSHGVFIVFDITNPTSFRNIKK